MLRLIPLTLYVSIAGCLEASVRDPVADGVLQWNLVEDLRLGSIDAAATDAFGAEIFLDVGTDGTIYIGDQQRAEVWVFEGNGNHLRTFGKEGSGPGEFRDLIGLFLDESDRIWTVDYGNQRFSIFDVSSRFLESRPYSGFRSAPWQGRLDRSGLLHNLVLTLVPSGPQLAYVRDIAGRGDTLALPAYSLVQRRITSDTGRQLLLNIPHTARPYWTMDNQGFLWFGTSDRYAIHRLDYRGDTLVSIIGEPQTTPLSAAERNEVITRLSESLGGTPLRVDEWMPEHREPFEGVTVDNMDRIWITVPNGVGQYRFDVYSPDAVLLGQATLEAGVRFRSRPLVRGSNLYLIARDEFDVPQVRRYRIEGSP